MQVMSLNFALAQKEITSFTVDMRVVRYTRCEIFHKLALKTSTMNRLKYH